MIKLKVTLSASATLAMMLLFCLAVPASANTAPQASSNIQATRNALAKYQDVYAAVRDGYLSTVACIDFPTGGTLSGMAYPAGAMGVHFVNFSAVGPKLDPLRPQILIYEPVADKLQLVAAEWFVPLSTGVKDRPQLFGQRFHGPMEGHFPVMPQELAHYDLHVWLWKNNPSGMFSPTNPNVKCPSTALTIHESTPKMPMEHH